MAEQTRAYRTGMVTALVGAPALRALVRGAALFGLTLVESALLLLPLSSILASAIWPGILLNGALIGPYIWLWLVPGVIADCVLGRRLLNVHRRLVGRWCGIEVAEPYMPRPRLERTEHGWYWNGYDYHKYRWLSRWQQHVRLAQRDPAVWRDTAWQAAGALLGLTAILPAALVAAALAGIGATAYVMTAGAWPAVATLGAVPLAAAGLLTAPRLLAAHGWMARLLLGPTERSRLQSRVRTLTASRADAIDTQAAELRRIERDLHDGAQARLVAMGLTLGAIEHLMDTDPLAARELLARTREASAQALSELRDLVRGIHPPVLAERGLPDAVRALALDSPLPVEVRVEMAGRLEAPVESAVYFAVSEALTNVAKHANARSATVVVAHSGRMLRVEVRDDGRGGADPAGGTGLAGLRRRLGTFDGTLAIDSPAGGPTRVTMELPCALSSPRTSTSSEKA